MAVAQLIESSKDLPEFPQGATAMDKVAGYLERSEARAKLHSIKDVQRLYAATPDGPLAAWLESEIKTGFPSLPFPAPADPTTATTTLLGLQAEIAKRRDARVPLQLQSMRADLKAKWRDGDKLLMQILRTDSPARFKSRSNESIERRDARVS